MDAEQKDMENEVVDVATENTTGKTNENNEQRSFENQNYSAENEDTTNNAGQGELREGGNNAEEDQLCLSNSELDKVDVSATNVDEGMKANINQVSKEGDLSPKQTSNPKSKGPKVDVPLQVQTRSSKGRSASSSQ